MPTVDAAGQSLLLVAALAVIAFGVLGAVIPLVPGPALVWFAALIYAALTGFREVGPAPLILLTLLMILGSTTNLWMSALGVKAVGGSFWGILGGMAGMFVGLVVLFPIGALIGAVIGVLAVEYARTGDWRKALRIGGGTVGGYLLGVIAEFLIASIMAGVFIISILLAHRVT